MQNTLTLKESAVSGSQFGVGSFVANQLDIGLTLNVGNRALFTSAEIYLYALYTFEDKTTQKIDIGTFYVDDSTVQRTRNSVSFTAYDGAINFDKPIAKNASFKNLAPYNLLSVACNACGMKLGTYQSEIERMANGKRTFSWTEQEQTYTYRDMVSYILQILGAFGRINRSTNKLEIVSFSTTADFEVTGDNAVSRTVSDTAVTVTGARFGETSVGAEGFVLELSGNPFLTSENESTVKSILASTIGFLSPIRFYTADITWFGDLSVQAGDCFTYAQDGLHGGRRKIIVMNSVWRSHGSCTLQSYGDTAAGAYSPISKIALAQAETLAYVKTNYVLSKVVEAEYLKAAQADITFAKITDLTAAEASINTLTADTANIKNILAGHVGTGDLQTINLTAENSTVSEQFAKEILAAKISVGDLLAGTISTNKFTIVSDSGNMKIADNTILIKDGSRARVQIGKDGNGDYSMYVWDKSGNLMFDALDGLHESGIKSGIIRNEMVADDAHISGGKIDMESLFSAMNGSEYTISSSKVFYDDEGQTLNIAFNKLSSTVMSAANTASAAAGSALSTANAVKSEVENLKTTVTSQGTQLNVIQGQISSKVWQSDITTAVDGIQIGGTQILRGTNTVTKLGAASTGQGNWSDGAWRAASYGSGIRTSITVTDAPTANIKLGWRFTSSGDTPNTDIAQENINITIGEKYVLSCYARAVSGSPELKIQYGKSQYKTTKFKPTSEWKQYSTAFVLESKYVNDNKFNVYFGLSNTVGTLDICGMKLETGTKPTDWSPAPEDIDSNITTLANQYSTLEQNLSSITATVANHTTDISQKADNSTVSALSSNVTQLTADLSGFKTTVSNTYTTKTEFNGLKVGGRNLFRDSGRWSEFKPGYWRSNGGGIELDPNVLYEGYSTLKTTVGTGIVGYPHTNNTTSATTWYQLEVGETYTYSAVIKSDTAYSGSSTSIPLHFHCSDGTANNSNKGITVISCDQKILKDEWKLLYITFKPLGKYFRPFIYLGNVLSAIFHIAYIKLEKGDKPTDWTPAPEDVDSSIATVDGKFANYSTTVQMNAAIKQTADSITSTVSKTYATQTTVNGIESHISTMQSSISQNADEISHKVSKNSIISEINQSPEQVTISASKINIAGFSIDDEKLYTVSDGKYIVINNNRKINAAMAFSSPSLTNHTNAALRITHSGEIHSLEYSGSSSSGSYKYNRAALTQGYMSFVEYQQSPLLEQSVKLSGGGIDFFSSASVSGTPTASIDYSSSSSPALTISSSSGIRLSGGSRMQISGDKISFGGTVSTHLDFANNYGLRWGGNNGLRYVSSGLYGAGLYLGITANSCDTYLYGGGNTHIYAGSGKAIKLHSPTYVYGDMTVERANLNMVNGYIDLANTYGITCGGNIAFRWNVSALYCGIDTAPLKLVGSSITLPSGSAVTSDKRLKNHIEPIDDRYMKLLDVIGGKKYFYNDYRKTTRNCGFIAQDLLTALSEVGLTADEFGAFCDVYGDGREYAIDYAQFIPILWEIVKKLKAEISAIKEEKSNESENF